MSMIPFMTSDGINFLKDNLRSENSSEKYVNYFKQPIAQWNQWINTALGFDPFVNSRFPMPDITLEMSSEDPVSTDFENVKLVYSKFKSLSDSVASDERIWAGLCMGPFRDYVVYRWGADSADSIRQHFFFGFGARRSLTRNALARLWWIGRLTYDKKRGNPYELTELVCENQDYIISVLERNTSNNPMIVGAFLDTVLKAREKFPKTWDRDKFRELAKYLNLLGGVYILDCMDEETLKKKLLDKSIEICTLPGNAFTSNTPAKATQTV